MIDWRAHGGREQARQLAFGFVVLLAASALTAIPVVRWLVDEEYGCDGTHFSDGTYLFSCGESAITASFYCTAPGDEAPIECSEVTW